ncbi:TPA: trypsin-like peptidase domain-containing protein [Vibrio cholerae]|uniref:trypsin-like peptidase domain-containing protein n=1 Tax=Vibrio cholerae TaxID=666 RepID=UPI0028DA87B2|nr:trypsin-like peptidase domain-containing protein [Vibrio cholerae]HDZ9219686.1 trypsin-like peptidase domain-containing protein [Vibrio cholerae]
MEEVTMISPLSISSVFIEMMYNEEPLGKGTAFYYREGEKLYLISNWHNFSGRNPDTGKAIHSAAAIPNRVKVYSHKIVGDGVEQQIDVHKLENDEGEALWFEHGNLGRKVDVGALPVELDYKVIDINEAITEIDPYSNYQTKIGEKLFVLGFPFGISVSNNLPIWKSASVASEPEIDCDSLPLFYVDTATREGMSGSPVVMYKDRAVSIITKDRGKINSHTQLVGVYSGRIIAKDLMEVQLGKVWKAKCIHDVINGSRYVDT